MKVAYFNSTEDVIISGSDVTSAEFQSVLHRWMLRNTFAYFHVDSYMEFRIA